MGMKVGAGRGQTQSQQLTRTTTLNRPKGVLRVQQSGAPRAGVVKASFSNFGASSTPAGSDSTPSNSSGAAPAAENATAINGTKGNGTAAPTSKPSTPPVLLTADRRKNFADPNLVGYQEALETINSYFPAFDIVNTEKEDGVVTTDGLHKRQSDATLQQVAQFFSDHPEYEYRLTKGGSAKIDRRIINSELTRAEEQVAQGDRDIGSVADNMLLPPLERAYRDAMWTLKANFPTYDTAKNTAPNEMISDEELSKAESFGHSSERLKSPQYFFNDHAEYKDRLRNGRPEIVLDDINSELRDIQRRQAEAQAGLVSRPSQVVPQS